MSGTPTRVSDDLSAIVALIVGGWWGATQSFIGELWQAFTGVWSFFLSHPIDSFTLDPLTRLPKLAMVGIDGIDRALSNYAGRLASVVVRSIADLAIRDIVWPKKLNQRVLTRRNVVSVVLETVIGRGYEVLVSGVVPAIAGVAQRTKFLSTLAGLLRGITPDAMLYLRDKIVGWTFRLVDVFFTIAGGLALTLLALEVVRIVRTPGEWDDFFEGTLSQDNPIVKDTILGWRRQRRK